MLSAYTKNSITNQLDTNRRSSWLTSTRLSTDWRGSQQEFVHKFVQTLREYNEMCAVDAKMSDAYLSNCSIQLFNRFQTFPLFSTFRMQQGEPLATSPHYPSKNTQVKFSKLLKPLMGTSTSARTNRVTTRPIRSIMST